MGYASTHQFIYSFPHTLIYPLTHINEKGHANNDYIRCVFKVECSRIHSVLGREEDFGISQIFLSANP